jgi:hypothetical protein
VDTQLGLVGVVVAGGGEAVIVGGTRVVVGEGLGTKIGVGAVEQAQSPERTDKARAMDKK